MARDDAPTSQEGPAGASRDAIEHKPLLLEQDAGAGSLEALGSSSPPPSSAGSAGLLSEAGLQARLWLPLAANLTLSYMISIITLGAAVVQSLK